MKLKDYQAALDVQLKRHYPIANTTHRNVRELSHFLPLVSDYTMLIPFEFNIKGEILDGKFAGSRITHVKTGGATKLFTWLEYIAWLMQLFPVVFNPCVDPKIYVNYIKSKKLIVEYQIEYFVATRGEKHASTEKPASRAASTEKSIKLYNVYMKVPRGYQVEWPTDPPFISHDNHFLFSSFNYDDNVSALGKELSRLIQTRDTHEEIHIHLNGNFGGQIHPVNVILLCLCGGREKWMKNQVAMQGIDDQAEWDPWEITGDVMRPLGMTLIDMQCMEKLRRYRGKITVHMFPSNGSATFFLISYLVYAFGKPRRFTRECYGEQLKGTGERSSEVKFGNGDSEQLTLLGTSGTTSGDGNDQVVTLDEARGIRARIPQQQFLTGSINSLDWNRFWTEI
jgi:hypothetical protein